MITIIIVEFNTKELLYNCLESIFSQTWKNKFEVWVVDNGSEDRSVEMVEKSFPKVKLIKNQENIGFAKANNQVLEKIESDYYLLLNSDTKVLSGSLDQMIDYMDKEKISIASCKLLNLDGSFQPNAGDLPFGRSLFLWLSGLDDIISRFKNGVPSFHQKDLFYYQNEKEVGWVGGTAMMISKEVKNKIGFLDPNIFMYGEDVEYCLRAKKAGFKIGWTPNALITHLGGGSSSNPKFRQWQGEFKGLLYIYHKYLGFLSQVFLRALIYFFIILRSIAFLLIGRFSVAKTYVKILYSL